MLNDLQNLVNVSLPMLNAKDYTKYSERERVIMAMFTTKRSLSKRLAERDDLLMECNETLDRVLTSEDIRRKYDKELANYYGYKEAGRQEGLAEGRQEGLEEGMEKGISIGTEANMKNIISNMFAKGYKTKEIAECIGKPIEYVKSLCGLSDALE